MIVLDTNVLSAVMRDPAEPRVVDWLDRQAPDSLWTTTVTVFEIGYGLALLPQGRRRDLLATAFQRVLEEDLAGRILSFDRPAAEVAGSLAALRQSAGRPVEIRDTQIAGIVTSRRAALATRNRRHFADLSVDILDPWGG